MIVLVRAVNNWLSDISLKWPCASPPSSLLHPMPFLPSFNTPQLPPQISSSEPPAKQSRNPAAVLSLSAPSDPARRGRQDSIDEREKHIGKGWMLLLPRRTPQREPPSRCLPGLRGRAPGRYGPPGAHGVNGVIAAIRGKSCGAASPAKSSARPLAHSPLPEPARRGGRAVITQARAAADVGRAAR